MRIHVSLIAVLALLAFPADTYKTLREKYGKPIFDVHAQPGGETYLVRPGVAVEARYGKSGHVCWLLIRPEPAAYPINSRKNAIGAKQVDEILNELVPPKERGDLMGGTFLNLNSLDPGTNSFGTEQEWQEVTILRNGDIDADQFARVQWKRSECAPDTNP